MAKTKDLHATRGKHCNHSLTESGTASGKSEHSSFELRLLFFRAESELTILDISLAYAELRTTLARMIFNFDMKLARKSEGWLDGQRVYNLWRKPPLYVHLTPRGESM